MKKYTGIILLFTLFACIQEPEQKQGNDMENSSNEAEELFNLIKEKDSLLFQIGFNKIDTAQAAALAAVDFEFYHDEHGATETKKDFVNSINGIRDLPFKTWRVLVDGSMEVFPMYTDNKQVLYGAIQNGTHDFYQQIEGEEARKTNTARFTHLWVVENDQWKLKRVFSYDHQVPAEQK